MQNPPTDETVAALFELAIAAEKAAQDLYQGLESMFSHVPVAAAFWHALMEDEAAHAHELEKTRAALTPMQLVMPADPLMMMKAKSILNFSVEGSLKSIQTLQDAYKLADDLENSEINLVFEFIMTEFMDKAASREMVVAQIRKHMAKLAEFGQAVGGVAWRSAIKANDAS